MRRIAVWAVGAVLSGALVISGAHAENLLDDGSFELADGGTQSSNSDWVMTSQLGNSLPVQFQSAPFAASDGETGVWFKPFTGVPDPGPSSGMLTQTITNIAQSGIYELKFDLAKELNFSADNVESFTVEFSSSGGNSEIFDVVAANIPVGNMVASSGGTEISMLLDALAGDDLTVTASMINAVPSTGAQSVLMDNFQVELVPEPSTVVLGIIGALGVGWASRRRK